MKVDAVVELVLPAGVEPACGNPAALTMSQPTGHARGLLPPQVQEGHGLVGRCARIPTGDDRNSTSAWVAEDRL
jgi:hypothetical protein